MTTQADRDKDVSPGSTVKSVRDDTANLEGQPPARQQQQTRTDDDTGGTDASPAAAKPQDYLYYCPECNCGIDETVSRKINGKLEVCCGQCNRDDLIAWQDYVEQQAQKQHV